MLYICKLRKEYQNCSLRLTEKKTVSRKVYQKDCLLLCCSISKHEKTQGWQKRVSFLYCSHCCLAERFRVLLLPLHLFLPVSFSLRSCYPELMSTCSHCGGFAFTVWKSAEFSLPWPGSNCVRSLQVKPWVINSLGQKSLLCCALVHVQLALK